MKKQQKDDVRDLLGKIRKLQENNQQIGSLQSDDIKKLLQEQKSPKVKLRLFEEEEVEMEVEETEQESQEVTPDEQREEENKFKDTVSKLVKFDKIKVEGRDRWG